jgi:hypothetical protein
LNENSGNEFSFHHQKSKEDIDLKIGYYSLELIKNKRNDG